MLLQAAATAQRSGDSAQAERCLRQALSYDPRNVDALQLLGLVLKGQGDLEGAASHMRQSLAINSRQPHVHHNLGNVLRAQGKLVDALAAYERATALKPDYADAYLHRAETLVALERPGEALPLARRAFQLAPTSVATRVGLSDVLMTLGELDEAETLLREGLIKAPGNLYLTHNLGLILRLKEDFANAVPLLRQAVAMAPQASEAWHNLGNALTGTGAFDEAVACYRRVLEIDPLYHNAHDNLNKLLWEMGRHDEVMTSFDAAKARYPNHAGLREMAAEIAIAFGRLDAAQTDIDRAEALGPGGVGIARLRTCLLTRQGEVARAIEVARAGLTAHPQDSELLRQATEACLRLGRADEGLHFANRLRAVDPHNQMALAYAATAARQLGDPLYGSLYDYDRLVVASTLPPPDGYDDIQSFNAALLAALVKLHVSQHEPLTQTLRHGTQTREGLFTRADAPAPVGQLARAVLTAVDRLRASLPEDDAHPFIQRRSQALSWAGSWSVRLREEGFHTDHIHPMGWISGCYYVEVPEAANDAVEKPGWIKFGQPNLGEGGPSLPWEKAVQPRPGLLVLFPSYMWHGTIPFHSQERRTTVAFDIAAGPRRPLKRS